MVNLNRFYTYAYLREDRTPYYIGKGTGNRAHKKRKDGINPPKDKSRIIFLKQNLIEEEAFKHEKYMIAVLGRKDLGTGILRNKTDGGEGTSGFKPSQETKMKQSKTMIDKYAEEKHPRCGKKHSEETKRKQSKARKKYSGENHPQYGKRGENSHRYGKKHSEETKRKQSEANKGKIKSEESKRKQSEKMKGRYTGENHHLYGKCRPQETKEKIRIKMKGRTPSEEAIRKQSEKIKGRKWWNDGCGNCLRSKECPGEGWVLGRGKLNKTL